VVVPLLVGSCSWQNARHLPAGRSRAGDRHLNFHDYQDNLRGLRTRRSSGSGRCGWCSTTRGEYPTQWKAIESIAKKLQVNHETLRQWVRRAETDAGQRPGLTTDEREQLRELERENKELRRANEILKAAASFFGFM
jgi:hypothetical protein